MLEKYRSKYAKTVKSDSETDLVKLQVYLELKQIKAKEITVNIIR